MFNVVDIKAEGFKLGEVDLLLRWGEIARQKAGAKNGEGTEVTTQRRRFSISPAVAPALPADSSP
jgi:hypothetical protein